MLKNIGSFAPRKWECLIPLLIILLSTYPRPSFDGRTPSAIKKELALKWSAMTLKLEMFFSLGFILTASAVELISLIK